MKKSIVALLVISVCVVGLTLLLKPDEEPGAVETVPALAESGLQVSSVERPEAKLSVPVKDVAVVQKSEGAVYGVVDPEAGYKERLEAMRKLGREMSEEDIVILMEFLSEPMSVDAKLRPLSYNSIRNDAYEILLRQKELPEGMGELLVSGYNSQEHDDMWRNYCIQFMQPFYERVAAEDVGHKEQSESGGSMALSSTDSETAVLSELKAIEDTLWDAMGERDNSNAGTALLALDKLSRNHDNFNTDDVDAAMLNLAQDSSATLANRVTALRLCGEHKNFQALETARDLARHGNTTMIRCAAIATLGEIGGEEDLTLLESYASSRDKRIAQVARSALEKGASN